MLELLKTKKVVLFGAGLNGKTMLKKLIKVGITPAYFVDNNRGIMSVEYAGNEGGGEFSVKTPEILLDENKSNLKIIITPDAPWFSEIEDQIREMGLGECLFSVRIRVKACRQILSNLGFFKEILGFCCDSSSGFNRTRPEFPYLDTAEETICNFMQKKSEIIGELCNQTNIDIAKPCINCTRLVDCDLFCENENKIKLINISCYPSICQAKCIYCTVHINPNNTYDTAEHSRYPKMIAEMLVYLKENDIIDDTCEIIFAPAEISIMPYRDLLLDAAARYRAKFMTNAFLFVPKMAESMRDNGSLINVSLDSGTRETFRVVKGVDVFEKVISNLKQYREYGEITIKYNIIVGVNDSDDDINGIINILKSLSINQLVLSFEYNAPLRAAFYSIAKFIMKLKENGLSFGFYAYYTPKQVEGLIEQYFATEFEDEYKQKNNHLREAFSERYTDNYDGYKKYIHYIEIKDLTEQFKKDTRFALLGAIKSDKYILSAFEKLGIPLQTPDLPYKKSYDAVKDSADVFIMRNKGKIHEIKSYIESAGGDSSRLLDIEKYYYSFEPTRVFLERNIAKEYLR